MRHRPRRLAAGGCRCPAGSSRTTCCPRPAALAGGRRRTEVHISARFARRGRKVLPPPRIVVSDPLGLATRVVTADEPAELLVLPRLEKVVTPPGEGDGSGPGGAPRAPVDRRRGRPRRPAPLPARRGGVAHLLAGAGARRRAHGAPAALRRRHAPARRARPAPARARGGPRRGRARRRLAVRAPGPRRRLRAAAARRPAPDRARADAHRLAAPARAPRAGRRPRRARTSRGWPRAGARCSTSPPTIRRARRGRWATRRAAGASSSCPAATGCPSAPRRAAHRAPRRRAPRGVHRRRLHRLRAQRQPPRGGGRLMARHGAAARRRWPPPRRRRARTPSVARLGAFAALGALRRRCTGARSSSPRRAATCCCRCSSPSPAAALLIALPAGWPELAAAHRRRRRWPSCCSSSPCSIAGVPLRHARAGASGTTSCRACAQGISSHAGHHGALPRHRRVGAHRDPLRRDRAAGARRAAGLLAAARRDAAATRSPRRSRSARSTRSRSSSTGPTRRTSTAPLFCILLAAFLWLERVRSDQVGVGHGLRGGHRDRRGRHRAAPRRPAAVVQLRAVRREARAQEGRGVLVDAQLRAADLVARRARDAAHQGRVAGLLEGDQPRRVRRRALARGRRRRATRSSSRATQPRAGCRRSRSSTAGCARRSSSAPATSRTSCPGASRLALPQSDGTFVTSTKPLRPGDSYQALVYVPHPSDNQLKRVGHPLPRLHAGLPRACSVPLRGASAGLVDQVTGRPLGPNADDPLRRLRHRAGGAGIVWPSGFGVQQDGDSVMADSPYAQLYALTQQIRREHEVALRLRAGRPGSRAAGDDLRREPAGSAPTRWRPSSSTPRPATASSSPA